MTAARSVDCRARGLAALLCPAMASAQLADRCLAVSQAPRLIQPANYRPAALKPTEVRLTFVGHATWLIESAGAVKIATDYNDYIRPQVVPDDRHHEPGAHHALLATSPIPASSTCCTAGTPRADRPSTT